MPGHERFVRTMISGATGMDAVLLVVAANEGVKPQTVEHISIAGLLGIRKAVVAISKTDLAARAQVDAVAANVSTLLARSGIEPLPPVMTSARPETGIETLRHALKALALDQPAHALDGSAWLPIDRVFSVPGHGPVVTGTLRGASMAAGDRLSLLPLGRPVRVRTVQVHGAPVAVALPGQRVALNLRDVRLDDLHRGMALASPRSLALSEWVTVSLKVLDGAQPLPNGRRLRALFGTDEAEARLRLLDRDVLEPGERSLVQLRFTRPVAIPARETVILRLGLHAGTVAGGRVIEPVGARLKRHHPPLLERLASLAALNADEIIAFEVAEAGAAGTTLQHLATLSALSCSAVAARLASLPVTVSTRGEVRPLAEEARRRQLAPRTNPERELADAQCAAELSALLEVAGLRPPLPDDILTSPQRRRALDRLLRAGVIIRADDRDKRKHLLFHRAAVAEARTRLVPLLVPPGLTVSEIAAALGISRKFAMPLLDHLDMIRFTRRAGDRRVRSE